jgi:peptidoglycan/xylan/chitin deacetylase (PgdA/CDA1 family)
MAPDVYIAWVDRELRESKRILEDKLKKSVNVLAYPFGGYDERIIERVRLAGYDVALTCDDGNITRFTDPLKLNRRLVYHHVKLKGFAKYFPDRTLVVGDLSPRDGERVHVQVPELSGRIINLQQIRPDSVRILVDKAGKTQVPVAIDPGTGRFRYPLPPKRGFYFVSLFAKDRMDPQLQREASWLFIISRNASKK